MTLTFMCEYNATFYVTWTKCEADLALYVDTGHLCLMDVSNLNLIEVTVICILILINNSLLYAPCLRT